HKRSARWTNKQQRRHMPLHCPTTNLRGLISQSNSLYYLQLTFPRPLVSIDQEAAIMTLLIPLLQPVGDFRRNHVPRSKGKGRAGKGSTPSDKEQNSAPTSMPEIYDNLTVGFNTTIRRLE